MEVVFIIFASITVWVVAPMYFFSKSRNRLSGEERKRLGYLESERDKNEERIRNLETIVCDVDMELNAKLNRMATQHLRIPSNAVTVEGEPSEALSSSPTELAAPGGPRLFGAGDRLSQRFVVVRSIGVGGMGEVYEAKDEVLGETVALKVLSSSALLEPDAMQRFRREASAARRITHPNVVRLHDIGEHEGVAFISMEYVPGQSLADKIRASGQLSLAEAAEVAAQVCAALEAAHQSGVVHRDLKPHNVLVDEQGQYRVIDFGVAKLPYLEGMTATGVIVGTPEYMAPEQISGKPVDARSDLYSLGVILYHAIAGHPPFTGDSAIAVGFAHCNDAIPKLAVHRKDVPQPWERFIAKALAKAPAERFQNAGEMTANIPP